MFRRRPLLRAAVVGGGAYMAGKSVARNSAERQAAEDEQNARLNDLEQQQAYQQAPPQDQQPPPQYQQAPPQDQQPPQYQQAPPQYQQAPPQYQQAPPQYQQAPPPAQAPAGSSAMIDQLNQLAALHDQGVLTDDEFAAAKAKLFGT